ncbi:MAG TPA: hypothetical protein PK224_10375 [Nitrospira sp.]|nr:hypothetical protein [Nitrospira sp.]
MVSRYTRVRKGPFTCATYQDGTQWIYVRVYHAHDEYTLGRYPTQDDAQLAYDEFSLQQALQRFPELTPEQQQLLQQTITAHPRVAKPVARMVRNWRPIELGPDFRHRKPSSPRRHASAEKPIRGIRQVFLKNGEPRWILALTHNHDVKCRRFSSLQDAEDYYREVQVQRALAAFPPLTDDQVKELTALQKEPLLRPVVDLLINCWMLAPRLKPKLNRRQGALPFQSGRPQHQSQKPTGPPPDPGITFADYAYRWFLATADRWSPASQDIVRSLCTAHLVPAFGPTPVRDLRTEMIAEWLQGQLKQYSLQHCCHMRTQLVSILYAAVADGLIASNPAVGPGCMLPFKALHNQRAR